MLFGTAQFSMHSIFKTIYQRMNQPSEGKDISIKSLKQSRVHSAEETVKNKLVNIMSRLET